QDRIGECCSVKAAPGQTCPGEVGSGKVCLLQLCTHQVHVDEKRISEDSTPKVGTMQVCVGQITSQGDDSRQCSSAEIEIGKAYTAENRPFYGDSSEIPFSPCVLCQEFIAVYLSPSPATGCPKKPRQTLEYTVAVLPWSRPSPGTRVIGIARRLFPAVQH